MDLERVPYVVYESEMARNERIIKRLIVALVISIFLIFVSNAIWLYAWLQYDYSSESTVTVDGKDGVANYIGNDGEISNGTNNSEKSKDKN